ncbi:MAG: hypothetical protein GH145_03945 [Firmicutes bacterium]|nr:hypothetical protein [Bacillota bacterium]
MKTRLFNKKILPLILIGGASLALVYFFIIRPQQTDLRKIFYREYGTLSELVNYLQEEKAVISQTINRFLETKEEKETGLVIPATLMDIFKGSKVEVTSITPVPRTTKGNLLVSSWRISVAADYHELGQFISTLERSMDFNRIDSLSIFSGETSAKHKAQLTVSKISLKKQ